MTDPRPEQNIEFASVVTFIQSLEPKTTSKLSSHLGLTGDIIEVFSNCPKQNKDGFIELLGYFINIMLKAPADRTKEEIADFPALGGKIFDEMRSWKKE